MMHLFSLAPVLLCVGLMVGAGFVLRVATRTPLARVPWIARRLHAHRAEQPRP